MSALNAAACEKHIPIARACESDIGEAAQAQKNGGAMAPPRELSGVMPALLAGIHVFLFAP
jgi:hypothetical protein